MLVCNDLVPDAVIDGIKGFIFDCDGVLLDSRAANTTYYSLFRQHLGLEPLTREEEDYVHSHAVHESLARIIPPGRMDEALAFRERLPYRELLPHLRLEPGIIELLGYLRSCGFRLGINTSRSNTMDLVLDYFGLRSFFQPVVTPFTVSNPKPHPEGVFKILSSWRMAPYEVVFIGDSPVDAQAAQRGGVRFWAYGGPLEHAQMEVREYQTLKRLLMRRYGAGVLGC